MEGCGTICKLRNFCNLSNRTAISAIGLQSQQSDCNLSNQTAISAIRLQSKQSDCNLSNQNKTPGIMPDTLLGAGTCISKLWNFCNLSNQTAITAIRLQSQQSNCNLRNPTAICAIQLQCRRIAVRLMRLHYDC